MISRLLLAILYTVCDKFVGSVFVEYVFNHKGKPYLTCFKSICPLYRVFK